MYISIRDYGTREVAKALGNEADIVQALKNLGLNAIELEYSPDDRVYLLELNGEEDRADLRTSEGKDLLRKQLARHKVRISSFLMHNNFGDPDMKRQIEWIVKCIEAAEYFAVGVIRIDPFITADKDVSIEEAAQITAEVLEKVFSQIPADKIIYLAIENHGKYGNNPAFLRKVIKEVNDERLGLTLDSGNFYWYGFPLEEVYNIFEDFASLARHTHIKNIKYPKEIQGIKREIGYRFHDYVCPIYGGDIDHGRFVKILKKVGYTGDLCIEDESLQKYSPEKIVEISKKNVAHLKSLISS